VPELPEVETIRRHLAPHVEGRRLETLEVTDERWCRPLTPGQIADATEGRVIERLGRRGKYLVFELSDDVFLLLHLRMTGTLLLDPVAAPYSRVRFALSDGHELRFSDPRRFGTGELAFGLDGLHDFFATRLGVEPLGDAFTTTHLRLLAKGARAPIKAFLLDQKRIAGVGNIYADEALFRARIHPLRVAGALKGPQLDALRDAVVASLEAGIAAKGATIDDFRDPYGVAGSFQDQFLVHTRAGEPCVNCGTTIVKLRAAGRGTYVCPSCQRPPRGQAAASTSSRRRPARSAAASS
jgi:formamidopyrimidine-DNA glycosylase